MIYKILQRSKSFWVLGTPDLRLEGREGGRGGWGLGRVEASLEGRKSELEDFKRKDRPTQRVLRGR